MKVEQFFYEHPVFRHDEFANWKAKHNAIQPASVNNALLYYAKTGRIKPLRRNLYAVIPPNQSAEDLDVDPYLIAGKATSDAILGFHTALEIRGMSYSAFGQYTFITEQKAKAFEFNGQLFQPVAASTVLQKKKLFTVYVDVINRQGVSIKVTSLARTFVDVLNRIELCGGWEEVVRAIDNFVVLNVDEVIDYCLSLKNSRLAAKVGYFLSLRKGAFKVDKKKLMPLLMMKPKVPQYVSRERDVEFQLVKQWNIFLPSYVINRKWEEPNDIF